MTSTGEHGRGRRTGYKPTKAEHEQRLSQIHALLVNNLSRKDICRYVSEKTTWGLTERSIDRYIAEATKMIQASAAFSRDLELGKAIARINDLYSRAHRVQDYKTCLAVQRELSELLGLYAPKRMEHTGPDGSPQQFIAIMPERPKDMEEWSRQCRPEQEERDGININLI